MTPNIHPFYRHSGRFNPLGPALALVAAVLVGIPAGLLYGNLMKWIPFIYLNVFITAGYGFAFGVLAMLILKWGKVRNTPVAVLCGVAVGFIAWYFSWSGHIHSLIDDAPLVLAPDQIWQVAKHLYAEGSWSVGRSSTSLVTGIPLATVWLVEGIMMLSLTTLVSYGAVGDTPFCEQHNCWLDQDKVMDKLDAFTHPDHLAAFKEGDIAPLEEARPRVPASGSFARLTLKHSPDCDDFCTLSIANVSVTLDKDGKPGEKVEPIVTNLQVPKTMFDYLAQFDHPTAKAPPSGY